MFFKKCFSVTVTCTLVCAERRGGKYTRDKNEPLARRQYLDTDAPLWGLVGKGGKIGLVFRRFFDIL